VISFGAPGHPFLRTLFRGRYDPRQRWIRLLIDNLLEEHSETEPIRISTAPSGLVGLRWASPESFECSVPKTPLWWRTTYETVRLYRQTKEIEPPFAPHLWGPATLAIGALPVPESTYPQLLEWPDVSSVPALPDEAI